MEYHRGISTLQRQESHPLVPALAAHIIDAIREIPTPKVYRLLGEHSREARF